MKLATATLNDFFRGVLVDNVNQAFPVTHTLAEFGSHDKTGEFGNERHDLERWIIKRLADVCPGYVRDAEEYAWKNNTRLNIPNV